MNHSKLTLIKEAPIPRVLLKLGLPAVVGMLVSALYNVVDAFFVGGLGTSQMGAVSIVFPIGQVIIGLGMAFGSGAASYIARLFGAGHSEKASRVASTALFSSLLVGAVATALSLLFLTPLLTALGATPTILPHARAYASIYLSGALFNLFNVTVNHTLTAEGASKITMVAMAAGGILNVILDPLFIYPLGLGVQGAALATVLSQAVSTAIYLWFILGRKGALRFSLRRFAPREGFYREIFKVGIPGLVFQLLASLALGLTNTAAAPFGDAAVAAMGVSARVLSLGSYILFGFMRGFQPLAGYSCGARQWGRLRQALRTTQRWTFVFCGVSAALLLAFAPALMGAFSQNTQVITIGSAALRANAVFFLFMGWQLAYGCLYLAMGRAKEGSLVSVSRQGLFFLPAILLLPRFFGLPGVVLAQPLADLLTLALTFFLTRPLKKQLARPQGSTFSPLPAREKSARAKQGPLGVQKGVKGG